ncbi:MAG: LacI family transcriptional regulator [Hyphomicrobiales bacterium]|nr:LacI family transcriptional regulator [Hyphomicrobiales bacterium]
MKEVAREARVSLGTVSNVLAGREIVSPKLKARVEAAIARTGYRHNGIAASLRQQRSRTIGVCIPDLSNPFFHGLAQALSWELEEDGYDALLIETNESGMRNDSKLQTLYSKQVEGVFLVPTVDWKGNYDSAVPHVILDRIREEEPLPSIALDNEGMTRLGVERLCALGHRRIWLVMNSSRLWNSALRRSGFSSACRDQGIDGECRVIEGGMDGHEIADAVFAALEIEAPPSAVIAGHGSATLGTLRALHTKSIAVPQTTSILAFDDIAWMEVLRPSISVIVQPFAEMARLGWSAMKDAIAGRSIDGLTVRLMGSLVERESTIPAIPSR